MVQTPKNQQNSKQSAKPVSKNSLSGKSESKTTQVSSRISLVKLDQLNYSADHSMEVDPQYEYPFSIVDRDWMIDLRRASEKRIKLEVGTINEDLCKNNFYKFTECNYIEGTPFILRNNLMLWYDYEILTREAWEYLHQSYGGFQIKRNFEVINGRFREEFNSLSLNVIINKEHSEPAAFLIQIKETFSPKELLSEIREKFALEEGEWSLVLVDTRLSLPEITFNISKGKVIGRVLDAEPRVIFKHLKDFEIILVTCTTSTIIEAPVPNIKGFCAQCRKDQQLSFSCSCVINSYCSIDCKSQDFVIHKMTCKELVHLKEDIQLDLSTLSGNAFNQSVVGLINIGNSCYINCLLQVLKIVPSIRNEFIKMNLESLSQSNFLMGFYHIMRKMQVYPGSGLKPWPFKLVLGLMSKQFLHNDQQDASECLDFILNELDTSGLAQVKAISDSLKGTTVVKFQCKDCQKIAVRDVEDPFFLFPLPLIAETPSREFVVGILDDKLHGFGLIQSLLEIKETDLSLQSLVEKSLTTKTGNRILVTSFDKKEDLIVIANDSDFLKFINERTISPDTPVHINLQEINIDSHFFLLINFCELIVISKLYFQQKRICPTKLIQVDLDFLFDKNSISLVNIHLRIFESMKSTIFGVFPSLEKVYQETMSLKYARSNESFYRALFKFKLADPTGLNSKGEPLSEAQLEENEYFAKLTKQIGDSLASLTELKGEKLYKLTYPHKGQVCSLCHTLDSGACNVDFSHTQTLEFAVGQMAVLRMNIELTKNSKLNQKIVKMCEKENCKPIREKENIHKQQFYLKTALASVFSWEKIERKCEGCSSNNSMMQTSLKRLPEILVIHFKRFKQIFDKKGNQKTVKVDEFVEFDFQITVGGCEYQLVGVVNHSGNLNDGHYTSATFDDASQTWLAYNDDVCEKIEDVQKIKRKTNYILFFKKIN